MKNLFVYRKGALGDTLAFIPFLFAAARQYGKIYFAGNYLYRSLFEGIDFIEYLDADSRPVFELLKGTRTAFEVPIDRSIVFSREPLSPNCSAEHYEPLPGNRWVYEYPFTVAGLIFDQQRIYLPVHYDFPCAGVCPEEPFVLIHPGSGGRRKRWPAGDFMYVGDAIERSGTPVLYITGEADEDILPLLGNRRNLHNSSFNKLVNLLAYSTCYLGCDSGVSHLAGLLNVSGFALFGPSSPDRYRPWGEITPVVSDDGCIESIGREKILALVGERIA